MNQPNTAASAPQVFRQEADTFGLTVTLSHDKLKLAFILKDYVDWVMYEKEYTLLDISEETRKKMRLEDVYEVFASTKGEQGERIEYKFGDMINSKYAPCYKIKKGGKISFCYSFKINEGKVIEHNMSLQLEKRQELTQLQKMVVESAVKVMQFSKKIEKINTEKDLKAEKDRAEKQEWLKKITKIEQQNKKFVSLEETIAFFAGSIIFAIFFFILSGCKISELSLKIDTLSLSSTESLKNSTEDLKQAIGEVNSDLQAQIKNLETTLKEFRQEITEINQISIEGRKVVREELANEISKAKQELSQKLLTQSQETQQKFNQNEQVLKPIVEINRIHSLDQTYYKKFMVQGAKVEHREGPIWHPYIFNKPIKPNENSRFKIKIMRTWDRQIMIGVVDYAEQKNERKFHESGSAFAYYGLSGKVHPSNYWQGNGFKQGDIVQVRVDRASANGEISWYVNGKRETSLSSNILADQMRVFMPYVQMWNNQDAVEWIIE